MIIFVQLPKNDGTVVGQMISDKTLRDIAKAIGDHIEPEIFPVIQNINLRGKECVQVEFRGNEVPYYAYGRAYARVGDSNRQLSAKEIQNIILEKNKDRLRWDNKVCDTANLADISSQKLKSFIKDSGLSYRNKENSLDKLGLLSKGQLLNTAVILFANNPGKYFPNAKLRCAVFGRIDTAYIVDRQEYTGDLFYLINSAETYILEHINIGMRLDGLVRVDVPEIAKDAFREAIINAFCHRDYYEYDSVNIAIFKDRLEIRNPGRLYGGLTIKQIRTKMVSQRRNELIADIFHRGRFVERWGRGISLILSNEPTAKFEEIGESFYVTFKRKNYESRMPHKTKLPENLSELQRIIMTNMLQKPRITYAQLVNITGKSREAIRKNINSLKKAGFIKRIGPDKGGHWQISKL
ncbi:MAG: ATP-binding protein [Thermodesulfobacteriota bacterium]|nr:ATP-binding protein [Thermodesulfobacteriota bacterium]